MRAQIRPCHKQVKSQPMTIIWTNLINLESPMLYTKIQPQSILGSGEEDFYVILPYICMVAILFNSVESFEQIVSTLSTDSPMPNLVKIAHTVSGKTFENYTILYMYINQVQGQTTPRGLIVFDCVGVKWHINPCGSFCVVSQRKGERDRRDSRGDEREVREERGTRMKVNKQNHTQAFCKNMKLEKGP